MQQCLYALHSTIASIDVVVVGGEDVCAGDTASVQCTLTGDILTWNTPQGAINILRGRQRSGETGAYTWRVEELDENTLQSTLIFMVTALITMGCDDGSNSSVVTVRIEGMLYIYMYFRRVALLYEWSLVPCVRLFVQS